MNEVFFTNVHVPLDGLLGEENKGWGYTKVLLGNERTTSADVPRCAALLAQVRDLAKNARVRGKPLIEDAHFARRLAQLEIEFLAPSLVLVTAKARPVWTNNAPLLNPDDENVFAVRLAPVTTGVGFLIFATQTKLFPLIIRFIQISLGQWNPNWKTECSPRLRRYSTPVGEPIENYP